MNIPGEAGWARLEAALGAAGAVADGPDLSALLRHAPSQRRSRASVLRILQAADSLLATTGYDELAAAPWPLVEKAGVTAGVFYHYFENGTAVLEGLGLVYYDSARRVVDEVAAAEFETWEAALDAITDAYADFYRVPSVRELWLNNNLGPAESEVGERVNAYIADVIADMLAAASQGSLRLPPQAARVLRTMGDTLVRYAFTRGPENLTALLTEAKIAKRGYCRTFLEGPDAALRG
jgi:AcrR family transcriptional regulator